MNTQEEPRQSAEEPQVTGFSRLDVLLLGLVAIWGINFSALKIGLDAMPAQVFNGARMGLAAVVFVGLLVARREWRWQPGDRWAIVTLGLLGHAAYQILFIEGLARTTAGNSALILASVPMWVAIIGVVRGTDRLPPRAWLGIALALAGVLVVIFGSGAAVALPAAGEGLVGDGLVLLATWCWAAYTAFSARLLRRYSPVQLTGLSLVGSMPVLGGVAVLAGLTVGWGTLTLDATGAMLFSGLLAVNLCYVIWYSGVQKLGGARTAVFSNLTPLVAILAAWISRGEPLRAVYLLGALLIAGGVLLTRIPAAPPQAAAPVSRSS